MKNFIFIYDYICPYCYLMFKEIKEISKTYDISIRWIPVEMFPETSQDGALLEKTIGIHQKQKIKKKVLGLAEKKKIPYYQPSILYNTHLAGILTDFANIQTNGKKTMDTVEELFNRVFVYNENIGSWDILYKVCINLALDFDGFQEVAKQDDLIDINKKWKLQYTQADIVKLPTVIMDDDIIHQGLYTGEELKKILK